MFDDPVPQIAKINFNALRTRAQVKSLGYTTDKFCKLKWIKKMMEEATWVGERMTQDTFGSVYVQQVDNISRTPRQMLLGNILREVLMVSQYTYAHARVENVDVGVHSDLALYR